jgi:hypothetical protein
MPKIQIDMGALATKRNSYGWVARRGITVARTRPAMSYNAEPWKLL